jgi:glycosyltransferase involved in cell wall biosynthesis
MAHPLRVAIDARCLNTEHVRGMGKYVAEMLARADVIDDMRWSLFGERPEMPFHVPALKCATKRAFEFKGYRFHTWEQIGLPSQASRPDIAQVLHSTATTLPWWQPLPTVVTVHDTLPWQHTAQGGFEGFYWWRLIPAALQRCAAVITISECSQRDILALWPGLEDKLHVVRHGISDIYLDPSDGPRPSCVQATIGDARYVLFVGGSAEHKRFAWALSCFEGVPDARLQLLVLGFTPDEAQVTRQRVPTALADRVHFLSFVPEGQMPQLYRHALVTLYPTRYEGFGFPAVESQAVGTPVMFSAVGSLAELVGPLATVMPLDDMQAWRAALCGLTDARCAPLSPSPSARAWAAGFSWTRSAQAHIAIYRAAAGSGVRS